MHLVKTKYIKKAQGTKGGNFSACGCVVEWAVAATVGEAGFKKCMLVSKVTKPLKGGAAAAYRRNGVALVRVTLPLKDGGVNLRLKIYCLKHSPV